MELQMINNYGIYFKLLLKCKSFVKASTNLILVSKIGYWTVFLARLCGTKIHMI